MNNNSSAATSIENIAVAVRLSLVVCTVIVWMMPEIQPLHRQDLPDH